MIYNQSPLTVPTYITAGEPVNASVVNRLVQNSNGLVTRVTESSNNLTVISGNSNVTITANQDVLILCNNTTNITVTLPPASTQYKKITIKKTANNTNTVTIQRAGSDTIEDPSNPLTTPTATSYVLATVDSSVTYVSSGNTWRCADLYITPEAWIAPTLSGSWTNFGGGFQTIAYRRVGDIVYLKGLAKNASLTVPSTIFTLPAGYRPPSDTIFPSVSEDVFGSVRITSVGVVSGFVAKDTDSWVTLDGISLRIT
jgi:hypothetical protein